mmetsp:Transcript_32444/g.91940  ORF Transcript_32444/g.91940 Transcript_32444/m.91940 type:complete len:212 (+) Transcript_32444:217-852(+)
MHTSFLVCGSKTPGSMWAVGCPAPAHVVLALDQSPVAFVVPIDCGARREPQLQRLETSSAAGGCMSSTSKRARPPTAATLAVMGTTLRPRCEATTAATGTQTQWKRPMNTQICLSCSSRSAEMAPIRLQSPEKAASISPSRNTKTAPCSPQLYRGLPTICDASSRGEDRSAPPSPVAFAPTVREWAALFDRAPMVESARREAGGIGGGSPL